MLMIYGCTYARIWEGHVLLLLGDEVHSPGACLITWPCVSCVIYVYLQDGKTALHHAACGGQLEAVRVLVQEFKLDPTHTWQGKLHLVVLSTLPHVSKKNVVTVQQPCVTVLNVALFSVSAVWKDTNGHCLIKWKYFTSFGIPGGS